MSKKIETVEDRWTDPRDARIAELERELEQLKTPVVGERIETVEAAVEVLNEIRYHDRTNWKCAPNRTRVYTQVHQKPATGSYYDTSTIAALDAIAIAQGILDARRIVELEAQVEDDRAYSKSVSKVIQSFIPDRSVDLLPHDLAICLGNRLVELEAENARLSALASGGHREDCGGLDEPNQRCECGWLQRSGGAEYVLAIEQENAELKQRHVAYQNGLERIANVAGVTTPLQLVAEADNNKQNYFDLLVKIIKRDLVDKLDQLKQRLEAETAGAALVRGQSQIAIDELEARIESLRRAIEPFVEVARAIIRSGDALRVIIEAHNSYGRVVTGQTIEPQQCRELVRVFDGEEANNANTL